MRDTVHMQTQSFEAQPRVQKINYSNISKKTSKFLDRTVLQKYKWLVNEGSPTGSYQFSTEMASEVPEVLLEVQSWAESSCIYGIFPREDYRELLALLYFVLGAKIRRKLLRGIRILDFKMKLPGAYDHVKFSAKAIYYIKMFMLLPQLIDRGLFDDVDVSTISRMSKFLTLLYEKYFLETDLTSSAPRITFLEKC